jgi:hypothetical protein
MIYNALDIPYDKRMFISIPLNIFDILISIFNFLEIFFIYFKNEKLISKFEDAAELARIVK